MQVLIIDDNTPESTETFTLNTGTITGGGIVNNGGAYGIASIVDNDVPPAFSYPSPTYSFTINAAITPLFLTHTGGAVPSGYASGVTTFAGTGVGGFADGPGTTAQLNGPVGIAFDAQGNIFVADYVNHRIRKITPAGVVSTFAGTGTAGNTDGPGASAQFRNPVGVAFDAQGNLYVAEWANYRIRKITPAGVVSTFAGTGTAGNTDGLGTSAQFNAPYGVAIDAQGDIYVADLNGNRIRKITPAGVVSTFAGTGTAGNADGPSTSAQFRNPAGVALDAQSNLYVAEFGSHRIRKITPAGVVSTLAGTGMLGFADGPGTSAQFRSPFGIAFDAQSNVYVGDYQNHRIRKISLEGYSISPALPAGLILNNDGSISGTPTATSTATTYTITGISASGSYATAVSITINNNQPPAPSNLSYTTPNTFTVGTAITPLIPTVTGTVTTYIAVTTLPVGLSINAVTGDITGTPTMASAAANYTVEASNSTGNTTTVVNIAVHVAAPSALSYASPNVYTVGTAIASLQPTVIGTVTGYSIAPGLPAGLSFDAITGIISGTPAAASAATSYTITATNSTGSVNTSVSIEVVAQIPPPSGLSYTSPNTFTVGAAITPMQPTVTGAATSYSINTPLPAGLTLSTATGVISGTPTTVAPASTYVITATNSTGSTSANVVLGVQPAAPSGLSYTSPNTFTLGTAITPLQPTVTGAVTSYSINTPLPAGLILNAATGIISGTPTVVSATATYVVTATNSSGSVPANVVIQVQIAAPSGLSYNNPNVFTAGTAIAPLTPAVTGMVTTYSIAPSLPFGLTLNTTTGVISGTPAAAHGPIAYTVTAANATGNTTATVSIEILIAAPSALSYTSPNTFTAGTAITPLTPTVTGTVTGYSIASPLPAGLTLNTTTGVISGTPTAAAATATYVVTATNSSGSTTTTVNIEIQVAAPSGLSYNNPNVFTAGVAITALQPAVTGTVAVYSAVTALPPGLIINSATGEISGVPTTASQAANYTLMASNSTGSTTAVVNIAVHIASPSSLSYTSPSIFILGTAITPLQPTVTGAVTNYSVSTPLPAGLILNATTGIISGTPTVAMPAANYNVTATNSTGSVSFPVSIGIRAAINYISPAAPLPVGGPITPILPAVTGAGYIYAISPGLPAGLLFDPATGIISGTPARPFATTTFTVTASAGQSAVSATVTLGAAVPPPAALTYSPMSLILNTGAAITLVSPAIAESGYSFSVSPGLPAGLSLNTTTGIISGTPTGTSSTTSYTITAANSGGSTSTVVSITVNGTLGAFGPIIRTYGDTAFAISAPAAPVPGTFVFTIANSTIASVSGSTVTPLKAGTTTVTATCTFAGGGAAVETTTLVIEPKELVVQPTNGAMCAQAPVPALTYTIAGFVQGENSSVLTSQPKAATIATRGSLAGTYAITASGGSANNYRFTYLQGNLQVHSPANSGMRLAAIDAVAGNPVQLQARSFGSGYQWSPAALLNSATVPAPVASLQQDAEFTIRITESSTGCVVTDTLPVRAHLGWQISMPDVFTPNGDGQNDVIKPIMPDISTFRTFRVYNRWGNLVFETNERGKGWDGRFGGALQPQETYLWLVEGVDRNGNKVIRRGAFTLLR